MTSRHRRGTSSSSQTAYGDPSAKIWGLYLSQAEKIDKEHSDSWTANTDGVLVFSGLFSATVAAFILTSYQSLQPNPSDTTNRLLFQISQQLSALSNGTPMPAQLIPPDKSSFQPTASAVRVNVLWFTSLALSTVCALWATLMQQWTRRYVQAADRPYAPPNRARIHAFFAEGVQKFGLGAAVEMLPGLLHTSFILFYIGLVDFFYNINDIVAHCLLALVALGFLLYVVLSIMPLFYPNSPYQTPLSTVLWFVMEVAPLVKHWLRSQTDVMRERRKRIGEGMRRALEKTAFNLNWQVDARALRWTLNSLDGDRELEEEFLDALPGVFRVSTSQDSQGLRKKMHKAVNSVAHELLATCSTGLLPEPARKQRLTACLGAIWCFRETTNRHCDAIWNQWSQTTNDPWGPLSTEAWAMAASRVMDSDPFIAFRAHCVQAMIAVMWRNGRWYCHRSEASPLLQRQLNASSITIEGYIAGTDHLQLAVAANLLSSMLRLLPLLETGPEMSLRTEIKEILDTMCERLDVSDVPEDLRARFVNGAEVMMVYEVHGVLRDSHRRRAAAAFDIDGPWTKIFSPVYDTISERPSGEIETSSFQT
ncbi:hypothetical protein BJV78DRAFT_1252285 [Lactifluus subvellereus]|nr:hypothetical protein BJV78DRAFT_1252285 [Lactifluus subvellereus]